MSEVILTNQLGVQYKKSDLKQTWINRWFANDAATPIAQVVIAIVFGILLAPWGSGLFFLVVFIIIYEVLYFEFTYGDPDYWNGEVRAAVAMAAIFGWIVGRELVEDDVLKEGVPEMPKF